MLQLLHTILLSFLLLFCSWIDLLCDSSLFCSALFNEDTNKTEPISEHKRKARSICWEEEFLPSCGLDRPRIDLLRRITKTMISSRTKKSIFQYHRPFSFYRSFCSINAKYTFVGLWCIYSIDYVFISLLISMGFVRFSSINGKNKIQIDQFFSALIVYFLLKIVSIVAWNRNQNSRNRNFWSNVNIRESKCKKTNRLQLKVPVCVFFIVFIILWVYIYTRIDRHTRSYRRSYVNYSTSFFLSLSSAWNRPTKCLSSFFFRSTNICLKILR